MYQNLSQFLNDVESHTKCNTKKIPFFKCNAVTYKTEFIPKLKSSVTVLRSYNTDVCYAFYHNGLEYAIVTDVYLSSTTYQHIHKFLKSHNVDVVLYLYTRSPRADRIVISFIKNNMDIKYHKSQWLDQRFKGFPEIIKEVTK